MPIALLVSKYGGLFLELVLLAGNCLDYSTKPVITTHLLLFLDIASVVSKSGATVLLTGDLMLITGNNPSKLLVSVVISCF